MKVIVIIVGLEVRHFRLEVLQYLLELLLLPMAKLR